MEFTATDIPTQDVVMKLFSKTVWIALTLGSCISFGELFWARWVEDQQLRVTFAQLAEARVTGLESDLRNNLQLLTAAKSVAQLAPAPQRDAFRQFATSALAGNTSIRALEYAPRIDDSTRGRFEQELRNEGYAQFRIAERSPHGAVVTAPVRPEYFPVIFIEPYRGNEPALGMDLLFQQQRRTALKSARDSGKAVATAPLRLIQEPEAQLGFLVFLPIYRNQPDTVEDRRNSITGVVLCVIRAGDLFANAIEKIPHSPQDIVTQVYDMTEGSAQWMLDYPARRPYGAISDIVYQRVVTFAGRNWNVKSSPTHAFVEQQESWQPEVIFASGLVLTLLLAGYLARASSREIMIEDLVAHRNAELSRSEAKLRAIVANVFNGIVVADQNGLITTFNTGAERMFGYHAEDVIGKNVNVLMPEPFHSQHDGYVNAYFNSRITRVIGTGRELIGRRKDSSTFPLYLALNSTTVDGQTIFVAIILDITEQKVIAKLKDEFVANISHELRTPLTAMKGALGLILGNVSGNLDPALRSTLDVAARNVERLINLVNDLLDVQKLENGRTTFRCTTIELLPLVEQTLHALSSYAQDREVRFAVTQRLPEARANLDSDRFAQVLTNLLSNAVKFSPKGTQVEINMKRRGDYICIEVLDRGPGIPANFRTQLFQRFAQAESTDARQRGGTGLGLAISKMLIEQMGGYIGHLDRAGGGSIFFVDVAEYRG